MNKELFLSFSLHFQPETQSAVLGENPLTPPLPHFIGKAQRITQIKELLYTTRLLTITGPGGSGKSQLTYHIIADLLPEYGHLIWMVDLSLLPTISAVPQALALALGQQLPPDRTWLDVFLEYLRSQKKILLILDHCEHLALSCASLVEQILSVCPEVQILTVSREPLNIAGEITWIIPLLSLPDLHSLSLPDELMHYEAIQLFVERAKIVQPAFRLTRQNMELVAQICCRLEGYPLAIELAAARVAILSLEQIRSRLSDCRSLLSGGYRLSLPRNQAMWTTLDYSYSLLTEKERWLFQRIAVFPKSFSLEAIETIGAYGDLHTWEITDLISHLVTKSLVLVERQGKETRYRLLEPVRQYSYQKLCESGEEAVINKLYRTWQPDKPPPDPGLEGEEDSLALRVSALGPVRVYRGDHALVPSDWRYAKACELLFYLLCHHTKTKEQICLALWPDTSPISLRRVFHTTLHYLRKALGSASWITFKDGYYSFNHSSHLWFDVEVFESYLLTAQKYCNHEPIRAIASLQEAVKLYQGNFLEADGLEFEGEWYLPRQRELQRKFLEALFSLGDLLFTEKQYEQASEIYRRVIDHDHYQEAAHRALMRCYARLGERGLALRHYRTIASIMHDELHSLPANETIALYEKLRRGEEI